jgi:uncharacterized protein
MCRLLSKTSPHMSSAASAPVVIAMLKAPLVGAVKTRLAEEIGHEAAVGIYRCLVVRQMAAVPADWRVEVHFAPADAGAAMRAWLGSGHDYFPQREGDLGARVQAAIDGAFSRGAPAVLVIGGDCPELDTGLLREAAKCLCEKSLVLGPAEDGGYYLIGMQRAQPDLFSNMPWSTAAVFAETVRRARTLGLKLNELPRLYDVDTADDLRRFPEIIDLPDEPAR